MLKIDKMSFVWGLIILEVPRVEQTCQDQGLVGQNPSEFSELPARYQVLFYPGLPGVLLKHIFCLGGLKPGWTTALMDLV